MFMKESSPSKSNIEGGECGSAGFINDICGHEKKTTNADLFSFVDVNGKHETINSPGITQECHDRKKGNFDLLTLPTTIQQNEHFELTHLDKIQEMEEIKERDFKWCDSLFDSYQNRIFENVFNDPELFLQDHVNKNWINGTCTTDSSELISNIVLDNFECQESMTHDVLSGCDLKWNEESDIENSFQHQMNEEDNCAFTLNGSTVEQMYGDVINCSKEYFELQPNIICEDNALSDSRVTEVNSKLSDQRGYDVSRVSERWPSTQSEILDSIPEVQTIENKKRKKQMKTGCDKRRKVIGRRPKLKNYDETLDICEHSQDANSSKQLSTLSNDNLEKHCSANLNDNYGILSRQEKIQSGVVLDGIMLSEDSPQKKIETKLGRNIIKRPRTKNKSKLEDNYDTEKNKLCNGELDSKQDEQNDCNNNTLTSPENTYLKNSSIFLEDATNSLTNDLNVDTVIAMNCDTDNAKCLVENNSPLRMKINLVKKEVVYCGYKSKKTNLRRIPKRSFRKRKNKINGDTQLTGHTERNEFLVPLSQGEGTKQQLALAPVHKRKYCKKNNSTTKLMQTNSLNGSMESLHCNGYPLVPKKRTKSVSLNCTNYDPNISTPSDNIKHSGKLCDIVDQSDLSYVLTSESVLEDCVLTYKDVLNLRTPERCVSNQNDNEIECREQLANCKENNSKHSAISETSQFSECDPSFEELDTEVNLENSSIAEEEISGFNRSDINSSALLVEAKAFEAAVEDLECTATAIKDVKHVMESKDRVIKSLQDKIDKNESNRLHKILERVISEVEESSIDEMSSASAIVRILWSYEEEKML